MHPYRSVKVPIFARLVTVDAGQAKRVNWTNEASSRIEEE